VTRTQVFGDFPLGVLTKNNPSLNTHHTMSMKNSIQDTIAYLHAFFVIPVQDTWLKSIQNGHFATWTYLTLDNVRKNLPRSDVMAKDHMNQIRQHIRSTQTAVAEPDTEPEMVQEENCSFIYAAIMETIQIYTYLTGIFPTTYLSGNNYIFILYDYDSNIVLSAPIKNRGDKEMVRAFDLLIQSLIIRGLKPSLQRLDTEPSLALINYLTKQVIDYQLAPPHIHRRKNDERTIQTFKNYLIVGLCSVDPNFPLKFWDKLLPQATITLSLLRNLWINPRMSGYAQLNGHSDFNRTPMAPPRTRIIAHEKPDQPALWDTRGIDGYCLGPALDHYRCYQVHFKKMGTQIVDNVEFSPSKTEMPQTSSKDLAAIASLELSNSLQNPAAVAPFSHIGTAQLQAMRQLSDIFTEALPTTTTQHAPPMYQASSQFRHTIPPDPVLMIGSPSQAQPSLSTPIQSPRLAWYPFQRLSPRQAPSLRVAPRVKPVNVASMGVNPTSQRHMHYIAYLIRI
jgi:hypothetical protein